MNQRLTITVITIFSLISVACSFSEHKEKKQVCSNDWYILVERQITTGDNFGHGPDLGSTEWRSVIEFKLGIRGNKQLPSRSSEQWCEYINNNYIAKE